MFFKRKKKIIESKYKLKDFVHFNYLGDLKFGHIYNIKKLDNGNIVYDIQVGGECPSLLTNIEEDKIFLN